MISQFQSESHHLQLVLKMFANINPLVKNYSISFPSRNKIKTRFILHNQLLGTDLLYGKEKALHQVFSLH